MADSLLQALVASQPGSQDGPLARTNNGFLERPTSEGRQLMDRARLMQMIQQLMAMIQMQGMQPGATDAQGQMMPAEGQMMAPQEDPGIMMGS
jgi:hypothetical protein